MTRAPPASLENCTAPAGSPDPLSSPAPSGSDVTLTVDGDVAGVALYTPKGTEPALKQLLPPGFELLPQAEGDFGARLNQGVQDLIASGHAGAILLNSDSPTLPRKIQYAQAV